MNRLVNPEFFKGSHFKSHPIQIPIKPYCNLAVASCLVTFLLPPLAYTPIRRYIDSALSKISKLALVGYDSNGAQSARAFFVRNPSASASYGRAEGGHFRVCESPRLLVDQPPFALPPYLLVVIIGKASNNLGAHSS